MTTIQQLAKDALAAQNDESLSGVGQLFVRVSMSLQSLLNETDPKIINKHPIVRVLFSRLVILEGGVDNLTSSEDWKRVKTLAAGE